jgi:hypothetical protein
MDAAHEVVAHFLTDFPLHQKLCKTQDYVRSYLAKRYAAEAVDGIITKFYRTISDTLIDEYDKRINERQILRYKILDADGERIAGMGRSWQKRLRVFQDALNDLSHADFEFLSAYILTLLGCQNVWITPLSHDQGLDAFGYARPFSLNVPYEISGQCRVVYLAQAKHYKRHPVGSSHLREFVGSRELAMHRIYSEDHRYEDLIIKPFGPSIMVFVTTAEIPHTVKTMARNAGIVVLGAQDLAVLFSGMQIIHPNRWKRKMITAALKQSTRGLATAR